MAETTAQATLALGTGRRKTAVARVRLKLGTGKVLVNAEAFERYFPTEGDRIDVLTPFNSTKVLGKYDLEARVSGGGKSGQAQAILLGVARALCKADPTLEPKLREDHLLTRDQRMKERKKYGRRGARRSFQFSKR
ncbi:MAG: 30S ribosomal protein S9 [Planctomycetes bacterium]|nr:30S ribosomal protein S9 [Planctomycetota bacterium]